MGKRSAGGKWSRRRGGEEGGVGKGRRDWTCTSCLLILSLTCGSMRKGDVSSHMHCARLCESRMTCRA
eukprot:709580-Hanusia_phi.AAC.1